MEKIKNKIKAVIQDSDNGRISFTTLLLSIISILYNIIITVDNLLYKKKIRKKKRLPSFVISVGNIVAGGTGKTPTVLYLAELIDKLGFKPAVISRGYKGLYEKKGGIITDGKKIYADAAGAGDEPFMIAKKLKNIPVIVGKDRYKAGMLAISEYGSNVIILDDGFQHRKLFRDLDLLLLDYKKPFGNKKLLPGGILREKIDSVKRADALILTRYEHIVEFRSVELEKITAVPVFKSRHIPFIIKNNRSVPENENLLKNKKAVIFSGIAKNKEFYNTVQRLGCSVVGSLKFGDHHKYIKKDFEKINLMSKKLKPDIIITTEKDSVKIPSDIKFFCDLIIIGIKIRFIDKNPINFDKFIEDKLKNGTA